MDANKMVYTVIISIIVLAIASGLYPTLVTYIDNITGSGFSGAILVGVISAIYWILVGAGVIFTFLKGFGITKGKGM